MFRPMTRERYLTDPELSRFMAAVRDRSHVHQPRDHALFAILANTGIRPSEALALERRDLHPHARPPWMHVARRKRLHAPAPITRLPLHPAVARVVATYLADARVTGRLFPFTKRQSFRLFRYYAGKSGLPAHYRIFSLRHTVGMRLWRHTEDLRMIHGIMGHVRTKAASSYVHVTPDRLRAVRERVGTVV
jgi:integrase